VSAALLAAVLTAPVALAAYLIDAAGTAGLQQVAAVTTTESGAPATPPATPLVIGQLYTSGPVKVDWNGVQIPVENSSYAYAGGELVSTPPGTMGILRLGDKGTIFICPESQVRLSREPSGLYSLDVLKGSSRFILDTQLPFQVRANETVITPEDGGFAPGRAQEKLVYTGEVQAQPRGGCVLCDLRGSLNVTTPDEAAGGSVSVLVSAGEILTVSAPDSQPAPAPAQKPAPGDSAGDSETASPFFLMQIPPALFSSMNVGRGAAMSSKGLSYLCKCQKLREYAREIAPILAETPTRIPGLELAEMELPAPFMPGLLPPTPAGPAEPLPVVVSPPLVPVAGTGGGGVVSPS
jgi:hypothetical protein